MATTPNTTNPSTSTSTNGGTSNNTPKKSWGKKVLLTLAGLFVVAQLVPYGRSHDNPPVVQEPAWDSPRTRELAMRACFDCHSNQTTWAWYSNIAPASWLVQHDVDEGRRELNFSDISRHQKHAAEAAEEVQEGEMPPKIYTIMHSEAVLTSAETQELIQGLQKTFGTEGKHGAKGGEQGEHQENKQENKEDRDDD